MNGIRVIFNDRAGMLARARVCCYFWLYGCLIGVRAGMRMHWATLLGWAVQGFLGGALRRTWRRHAPATDSCWTTVGHKRSAWVSDIRDKVPRLADRYVSFHDIRIVGLGRYHETAYFIIVLIGSDSIADKCTVHTHMFINVVLFDMCTHDCSYLMASGLYCDYIIINLSIGLWDWCTQSM